MDDRVEAVSKLIKKYKNGGDPAQVKREAKAIFAHLRSDELTNIEDLLTQQGLKPQDLHEVYTLHLSNLHAELKQLVSAVEPWHPIRTMIEEHEYILATLERLEKLNFRVQNAQAIDDDMAQQLKTLASDLLAAEHHHLREEEVIFPELTNRGIGGPVKIMAMEHDELRAKKRELNDLAAKPISNLATFKEQLDDLADYLVYNLADHIYKENHILYPAAVRLINDYELWTELKRKCDEIGYCTFSH
jgi:DUF438 domain-containing protein